MLEKCPFYPNDIDPCKIRNCKFSCNSGCGIQLAAYALDSYRGIEEIKEKMESIEYKLRQIESKL